MQRNKIKKLAKENMNMRSISETSLYVIEGVVEDCMRTLMNDIAEEAKRRNHRKLGPQHLKHCLGNFDILNKIMGKAVRKAPGIDEAVDKPRKRKGAGAVQETCDFDDSSDSDMGGDGDSSSLGL
mmetsp:Transcript_26500/g.63997  ORF Transcript_26500/g.63997 Transcript_26500/m.63997 type:complete len:125 (+) Transcript_26500:1895-2269(+)